MFELNRPERRALLLGATLLVVGGAVRVGLGPGPAAVDWETADETSQPAAPGARPKHAEQPRGSQTELSRVRGRVERNLARSRRASVPLAPGEKIDLGRASIEELERLPGVGPATARRIVKERERSGGFSRPEELGRVPGIGPKRMSRILPFLLDHSLPYFERRHGSRRPPLDTQGLSRPAPPPLAPPPTRDHGVLLDLNSATEDELVKLPGVGPSIARRIVTMREREGPFQDVQALRKVPGIGPARFDFIKNLVVIR